MIVKIVGVSFLHTLIFLGRANAQSSCSALCTQNGGKCVQEFDSPSYTCNCTGTGGSGPNCSGGKSVPSLAPFSNSTAKSPSSGSCPVACVNGRCLQQTDSSNYYCSCNIGFRGTACNVTAAASPSTTSSSSGTYSCPIPCYNGQCVQEYDSSAYRCTCKSGYSGASCNTASSPAKAPTTAPTANSSATPSGTYSCPVACDHGQCVEEFGSYVCACSPGYSGLSCTTASTPAGAPAPNGTCTWCQHGTCKPIANSQNEHYCECQTGYSNWDCATVSASTSSASEHLHEHGGRTLKGWKIFVIVLAAMVGVVMAASVAYIFYRRRQGPKTFVKFRDTEIGGSADIEIERSSTR